MAKKGGDSEASLCLSRVCMCVLMLSSLLFLRIWLRSAPPTTTTTTTSPPSFPLRRLPFPSLSHMHTSHPPSLMCVCVLLSLRLCLASCLCLLTYMHAHSHRKRANEACVRERRSTWDGAKGNVQGGQMRRGKKQSKANSGALFLSPVG